MATVVEQGADTRTILTALLRRHWPVALGISVILIPTFIQLASEIWSTEAGVHGPIVLATGGWLLMRAWPGVKDAARSGSPLVGWTLLVGALIVYVAGRAFSFISLEVAAAIGVLLACAWLYVGPEVLRRLWFPIFYLCFMIPLPGWLIDTVTAPLKQFISVSATHLLYWAGYPIAREGVTLYIAQYQLLVEDACAGLNSIMSLTSISLFYIYLLHNASWRYSMLLVGWILPAAIFANLVRVIMIVLITYYFGNEAAQGFLHGTAGLVMFVVALLFIFAVDRLMDPIRLWLARGKEVAA
jgi:exosortase B